METKTIEFSGGKSLELMPFTKEHLDFWKQYWLNIEHLEKFNVCAVKSYKKSVKSREVIYKEPVFVYLQDGYGKIYQPFSKDKRFKFFTIGDKPENAVFGLQQIPERKGKGKEDVVFIVGGEKDVITTSEIMGYPAISPWSENALLNSITQDLINNLKSRFKHVMVMFDIDKTGVENSAMLASKYNLQVLDLPDLTNI